MQISRNTVFSTVFVSILLGAGSNFAQADTIHVPAGGDIQAAINIAANGDVVQLEKGHYWPSSTLDTLGKAITLRGVAVKGGDPGSIIDAQRSMRVLKCVSGEGPRTVFDTLKFTNGYAAGQFPNDSGGGMYIKDSSPRIINCHFEDNRAGMFGGGLYNDIGSASPTIINCVFRFNDSDGAFGTGGGICSKNGTNTTVINCLFEGNLADGSISTGGGMCFLDASGTVAGCTFVENIASATLDLTAFGGGLAVLGGDVEVTDSKFENNTADLYGGLYADYSPVFLALTNTTVCGNTPDQIGGSWYDNGGNSVSDECACPGDYNGDGQVNVQDLIAVISGWGNPYDGSDLNQVLVSWNTSCD